MQIKLKPTKRKRPKFIFGIEQEMEKPQGRLPQLNKFYRRRANG